MTNPCADLSGNPFIPTEVKALMRALHLKRARFDDLRCLCDEEWRRLLRFADLAHLTLRLALLDIDGLPEWVQQRLQQNLVDNRRRFELIQSTYAEAAEILRSENIKFTVIKGFALCPDFIPSPWMRQQSDIDICCSLADIQRAQNALSRIGYVPDSRLNYKFADHTPTMLRLGDWKWRGNAFDPQMPLSIELHYCLWNRRTSFLAIDLDEAFLPRAQVREIEGLSVPSLSSVDQLGYFSLHILRNLLTGDCVLHHLTELAIFLNRRSTETEYWAEWEAQHDESLRQKEVIAFELARRWFGCNLPDAAKGLIDALPGSQQRWLIQFTYSPLEGLFRENKDGLWLHWSLLSEESQRLRLLRRHFFPNLIPDPDNAGMVLNERRLRNTVESTGLHKIRRILEYCRKRLFPYCNVRIRTLYRGALWIAQG